MYMYVHVLVHEDIRLYLYMYNDITYMYMYDVLMYYRSITSYH